MSVSRIRHVEELAANGWPAPDVQVVDGWRLRFNWGVTDRANSVWPNHHGGTIPLGERLELVEAFYREREQRAAYQMCPAALPEDLDAVLAARGYDQSDAVCVQTVDVETGCEALTPVPGMTVTLESEPTDEWMAILQSAEGWTDAATINRQRNLRNIVPVRVYATAIDNGRPVAVGRAVREDGWVGIFGMGTLPDHRGRGAGRTVLRALLDWGAAGGAAAAYLQVLGHNASACALYARAGFRTLYHYYYRTKDIV